MNPELREYYSKNVEDVDLLYFFTLLDIKRVSELLGKKITIQEAAIIYSTTQQSRSTWGVN